MRIGISVITHEGQNIWENGLGQNVIFLARLFRRVPFVRSVVLIDVGLQRALPPQVDGHALDAPVMGLQDATDQVDVVIELGGAIDPQWLALQRARGKKVVYHCVGQPYVGLIEPPMFDKPGSFVGDGRCDAVWLLPKDRDFTSMMRLMQRCEVFEVPYLWEPLFVQRRAAEVADSGYRYGWVAPAAGAGLRCAIFEPNVSTVKTSSIPMLACDEAYRADRGSVAAMHVLNTLHLKDHPTMLHLANSLDLVRDHKATFHGRHDIVGFMVQHADAVVSHQWHNDQNYAYLDALWGDYPLIHNSPWLGDAGYAYKDFDAAQAGRQLRLAHASHGAALADYRARSQRVFDAVDPAAAPNIEHYAHRLLALGRSMGEAA